MTESTENTKFDDPYGKDGKLYTFGREKCSVKLSNRLRELNNKKYWRKVQRRMSEYHAELNAIVGSGMETRYRLSNLLYLKEYYIRRLQDLLIDDTVRNIMKCCMIAWWRQMDEAIKSNDKHRIEIERELRDEESHPDRKALEWIEKIHRELKIGEDRKNAKNH